MTRSGTGAQDDTPILLGLLGHPVAHSVSPAMHNAALAAANLAGVYVARDVTDVGLSHALDGLAPLGFLGVNITVPHKQVVAARCATLSAEARDIGAVNTVVVVDGRLHGDNTDASGFLAALPAGLSPATALVVGAGGAARAVVVALVRSGWDVVVAARRPAQAVQLEALATGHPGEVRGHDLATVAAVVATAQLVVNATPVGLQGDRLPDPLHRLGTGHVACDLVYNPLATPFLQDAASRGATVVDGLGMLVGQAAASFRLWTGVTPDTEVMRRAALALL